MRDIPVDKIRAILKEEPDSRKAFKQVLELAGETFPSLIWNEFENMDMERDIQEAGIWLQNQLNDFPSYTGIYLGLDTLNMEDGYGYNVEIRLSDSCNPHVLGGEWPYECQFYGENHLIRGLSDVSDNFVNNTKWTPEEQSFSEYLIFLSYSGIVLREVLISAKPATDFLSIWGFHDGDMFFLIQRKNNRNTILTEI